MLDTHPIMLLLSADAALQDPWMSIWHKLQALSCAEMLPLGW